MSTNTKLLNRPLQGNCIALPIPLWRHQAELCRCKGAGAPSCGLRRPATMTHPAGAGLCPWAPPDVSNKQVYISFPLCLSLYTCIYRYIMCWYCIHPIILSLPIACLLMAYCFPCYWAGCEDPNVRTWFQMAKSTWAFEDFAAYFNAHDDTWEYKGEKGKESVRYLKVDQEEINSKAI